MSTPNSLAVGVMAIAALGTSLLLERSTAFAGTQTPGNQPPVVSSGQVRVKGTDTELGNPRPAVGSKAMAALIWSITEAVAAHHDKPSSRPQMLSATLKALYKAAKLGVPPDLAHRSSEIANSTQLASLLDKVLLTKEAPTEASLENAMLQGLLASIPGKAQLVEPPSKKEMAVQEQVNANRYVGIGITLGMTAPAKAEDKSTVRPVVIATILHAAARKAGMKAGDAIESVDEKDTRNVALAQVVDWLRGEEGSKVTVVVRQPGDAQSRTYQMTRAKVPFEHVYGYRRIAEEEFDFKVDPSSPIAYLRMGSFSSSSLHELRQFERKLQGAGFRALVLDLRGAPGGSLQHAALVCGGLLDGNLMWTVRQDRVGSVQEFRADHECLFRDWPMVVLINGQVGSAAALVAAALHDNGRAVLVGESPRTDGFIKGVVELPGQKENLVLATGRVERPTPAHSWPLHPDFQVALPSAERKPLLEWMRLQETSDRKFDPNTKAPADAQLAKATEVLRTSLAKANLTKNP